MKDSEVLALFLIEIEQYCSLLRINKLLQQYKKSSSIVKRYNWYQDCRTAQHGHPTPYYIVSKILTDTKVLLKLYPRSCIGVNRIKAG